MNFQYCDKLIHDFLNVVEKPVIVKNAKYYTGVDLGTACVVICVLNEKGEPIAGEYRYANVVKDGMVVDYLGAIQIVREMKQRLEEKLNIELDNAAVALPPGTALLDFGAVKHVAESAGFEVTHIFDEPTAANEILKIKNGAIVDIGGGTTGISIIKDSQVVYVSDEPTGGTHFSLVVAGAYNLSYDEAERYKRDYKNHPELFEVVKPVIEKVASIITSHIAGYDVDEIILVGGTACLSKIEDIIAGQTGVSTRKPHNPMFVTPLGIALGCLNKSKQCVADESN
jgi:ethanolamine utilization protein EutJ